MNVLLPEELELVGTVEPNVRALSDRLAPADGVVVDLLVPAGSFVKRGTPVLTISGEAYVAAQHEFINAFTEGAGATLALADLALPLKAREAALRALKLASSQIDQIRTSRRVIDPLPVLCPVDAIIMSTTSPKVSFSAETSLFSYAKEQCIRFWMDAQHAEYLRPSKQATVILPDGRHFAASLDTLGGCDPNGAREIWLKADSLVAVADQPVQVKFHFKPFERVTPSCTSTDWPYPNQPRGHDLRRLHELHAQKTGTIPPPITWPPSPKTKPTKSGVVSFLSSRPQRAPARYRDPALSGAPASTRHSLLIGPQEFERLGISTSKATVRSIVPHWRCAAQVMDDPPLEQTFHATAPLAGIFVPAPLIRNDPVNAGQLIGTVRLSEQSIAAQRIFLHERRDTVREDAMRTLRAMGFVHRDFDTIRQRQEAITEIQINANTSGVVLECAEHERVVLAGETVMQLLCMNVHLVRASIGAAEYAQLPLLVKADLYRPFQSDLLYSTDTLRVTERCRQAYSILFDAILPADRQRLKPGHILDLVLSDPTRTISKLCIPRDCIMKIGQSHEVLIHSQGGLFTPAAIKMGKTHGKDVEVLSGISEGCFVVRDLEPLSHESREIRAIMVGFWEPRQRSSGPAF